MAAIRADGSETINLMRHTAGRKGEATTSSYELNYEEKGARRHIYQVRFRGLLSEREILR